MKTLDEKRDELAINYVKHCQDNMHAVYGVAEAYCKADFKAGWDACAKDYESRIYDLEKKLKIATKVLTEQCCIDDCGFDVENEDIEILRNCMKAIDSEARKSLDELEKDSNDFAKSKDEVRLWNENESLKKKLKIATNAFLDIEILTTEALVDEKRIWRCATKALEEVESAGE